MFESLAEALMAFLSAGGFVSVFVCSLLKRALNKAREDAERRKAERNKQELLRLEGEEKIASLVLILARYSRGKCEEEELEKAENDYLAYTEKAKAEKRRIISDTLTQ
ncbi:MAG: hypothetical protein E7674_00490 [Ruminococcaceae bacterium]|nr:hypothetical protein [Oscillospiraceae bacterium]MBQ3598977.1 hypothetical protein [Clostridia bacterium]MBR2915199.1 hypothetical protein [Clostridia bacterium]